MRKKGKGSLGMMGAFAIAVAAALGGANQANALPMQAQTQQSQQNKKDAAPVEKKQVRAESVRNIHGGFSGVQNPYKHIRKGERNQRQLRKFLRSNPSLRKKYGK